MNTLVDFGGIQRMQINGGAEVSTAGEKKSAPTRKNGSISMFGDGQTTLKQFLLSALSLFVALSTLVAVSLGQTADTGAISGLITDPKGAVVAGAAIKTISMTTGETRAAVSSGSGAYQIGRAHV